MEPNPGTELSISRTLFFKEPKQLNLKSLWLQSMWDVCGSKKSTEVTTEVTRFSRIDFPAVTVTYNTVFKAFFFLLLLLNWLGNLKIWKSAKKKWRKKTATNGGDSLSNGSKCQEPSPSPQDVAPCGKVEQFVVGWLW